MCSVKKQKQSNAKMLEGLFFGLWCLKRILNGWRLFNKRDVAHLLFSETKMEPHLKCRFYYINIKMLPLYKWGSDLKRKAGKRKHFFYLACKLDWVAFVRSFCGNSHHSGWQQSVEPRCIFNFFVKAFQRYSNIYFFVLMFETGRCNSPSAFNWPPMWQK